uniref:early activation antigen CD69 isoform X2 n=1 Tax=Semicossyphus pulcher TaxID=241346 RepID=UPI0037E734E9
MYIKFCRSYGEDKKDEAGEKFSPASELSVELDGEKGKQADGKTRMYRAACVFLTILSLILLLVVIILCVKPQNGSTVCPEREEIAAPSVKQVVSPCNYKRCQAFFPNIQLQYLGCRQCADGWLTFGRSCFYLSTFRLSWDESQRNCSARGGNLAVINNPGIQSFLSREGRMTYWIGLRQNGPKWTWVNNTALGESYWADASSDGDCALLSTGSNQPEESWIRASCRATSYFICQLWS